MNKNLLEKYSAEELEKKYNEFMELIENSFNGERLEQLKELYSSDNFGQELIVAPASGKLHYHNCYVGGYIDHINNVINNSKRASKFYEYAGGTIDWTEEELIFSAMHHDLGKLGDENGPYFIPQESVWHQEKQNEYFIHNPRIQWIGPTDRALYILNKFGIKFTWKEMLAIQLSDGLYDDKNAFNLKVYQHEKSLKTNLPHVIHVGDFISCQTERDTFIRDNGSFI